MPPFRVHGHTVAGMLLYCNELTSERGAECPDAREQDLTDTIAEGFSGRNDSFWQRLTRRKLGHCARDRPHGDGAVCRRVRLEG